MIAGALGGQKRAQDPVKLELQTVVRSLMWVQRTNSGPGKNRIASEPQSHLSSPNSFSFRLLVRNEKL